MAGKTKVNMTSDTFAKNWAGRMTQSVPKMQEGVKAVTENPMAKAAAAADKYQANVIASVQSGRYANSLNAVDFGNWKSVTVEKMGARVAGGVTAAQPKMVKFGNWLLPTLSSGMAQVAQMPDMTLEDNINRMVFMARYMSQNSYKG